MAFKRRNRHVEFTFYTMQCGSVFSFKTPSSILVIGPSSSGKTVFTAKLLTNNLNLFATRPKRVVYCYGAWQDKFETMQKKGIRFHEGIPDSEQLPKWFPEGGVMILDDLMQEAGKDKRVLDLFTKYSHHQNVTVLYLCQDMFPPGKYAKSISRNAHYIVAFKNPRDQLGFRNVVLQAFPNQWKAVQERFQQVTDQPYGYMVLDLHPGSSDKQRLLSHVLKEDGTTRCYQFKQ